MKYSLFAFLIFFQVAYAKVDAIYLTFGQDPSTTMVVTWHGSQDQNQLSLREGKAWKTYEAKTSKMGASAIYIHRLYIDGLAPDAAYRFKVSGDTEEFLFKTMPDTLNRKVKFAVGGDVYRFLYLFRRIGEQIAAQDPDFIVVGGDIGYTKGNTTLFKDKNWEVKRWGTFFKEWKTHMRGKDGRLLPMVVVLGNHDIQDPKTDLFFDLFYYPKTRKAFDVHDFGDYLSLFILDTGHATPIRGEQTSWLEQSLQQRENRVCKMAAYHVAAYPSVYPYEGAKPKEIRSTWVPLFEKYGIKLCFEHHNHAYKRTFPLYQGKVDPKGILYIGDGAWGVEPREPKKRWYLAKAAAINYFSLITLDEKNSVKIEAFGLEGQTVDEPQTLSFEATAALPK